MVDRSVPILVPVDFSPASEAALLWASNAADAFGAPLHVLHVVHDPSAEPGFYVRADGAGGPRPLEEVACELLDEFLAAVRARHPQCAPLQEAGAQLVTGLPVTRILEIADELDARFLVMGCRGLTGLEHLMLGSTVERVLHLSARPVVVVKADAGA